MKITLIRHGITEGNEKKHYIGSIDQNLSEKGKKEIYNYKIKGIYPKLNNEMLVYTSPMLRCKETLNIIYSNCKYAVVDDLREMNFGLFEGKTHEEIISVPEYAAFGSDEGMMFFPEGEDIFEFKKRCTDAFELIIKSGHDSVIFCHGGVIMAILEKFGIPEGNFYKWFVNNGEGFIIYIDEFGNTERVDKICV